MLGKSITFSSIRKAIDGVPVVDCHDHTAGYRSAPEYKEPIASLIQGYMQSDLISAGGEPYMRMLNDHSNPRFSVGFPELTPLSDYLFHQFMRMARDLDFFVQIHTGHMAGIRNEITKTNAVLLTSVLEMHPEVRFDIFHGNWPYDGEILFLAKNYPNVHIDACWLNIIDAYYARRLFANSIMAAPHTKVHGFGADYGDVPEYAVCHLLVTKDAIAAGLAEVVDMGWLTEKEAIKVAADWLFNNPNEWYRLGFNPVEM